jgi:hypothetical protein
MWLEQVPKPLVVLRALVPMHLDWVPRRPKLDLTVEKMFDLDWVPQPPSMDLQTDYLHVD